MTETSPKAVITSARRNIRRRRTANSCEACRRRKIRCDQKLPCAACVRAKGAMVCVYRDGTPSNIVSDASPRTNVVQDDSPSSGFQASTPSTAATQANLSDAETSLRKQNEESLPLQSSLRESLARNAPIPGAPTAAEGPSSASVSIPVPLPRLRQTADKTKMFGVSHWVHLADKMPTSQGFDGVEDQLTSDGTKEDIIKVCRDISQQRKIVKYHHAADDPMPVLNLFDTFPPKATCDELLDGYLRTFEPLYRILHVPIFLKMYQGIWEPQFLASATCPADIAKIALTMAIGATFYPYSDDTQRKSTRVLAQTWITSVQAWMMKPGDKVNCTFNGLQLHCLLFLARHSTYHCPGPAGWISGGSLLTIAMWMGLHRDPRIFPNLSPMQQQMRVRLWTTVLELAVQSGFDTAMPIGINVEGYDVPLPLNIDDYQLEKPTDSGALEESEGFTDSSLQILLAKSLTLRLRMVHQFNSFREKDDCDTILELGSQLRHAIHEASTLLRSEAFCQREPSSGPTLVVSDFHRKTMDILLRRFSLRLHRNAMMQSRVDPRLYFARRVCLESAMVILGHSGEAAMDVPAQELDDLSRLCLVGRGLFKAPLDLEPLLCICFEIFSQFGKQQSSELDPLGNLARAERAPLINQLETSSRQLSQIVHTGTASFKRHILLLVALNQIRTLENGGTPGSKFAEGVASEVKKLQQRLEEQLPKTSSEPTSVANFLDECQPMDPFPMLDVGFEDVMMGWDISNILNFNFGSMDMT